MRYFTDKKDNFDCFIDYTQENGCLKTALQNLTYFTPDMLNLAGIHPELTNLLMQPKSSKVASNINNSNKIGES